MPSVLCVHINLHSSDQEKKLWLLKYFNEASVCLCVLFNWRSLHFSVRVSPSFLIILCYPSFGTFLSIYIFIIIFTSCNIYEFRFLLALLRNLPPIRLPSYADWKLLQYQLHSNLENTQLPYLFPLFIYFMKYQYIWVCF